MWFVLGILMGLIILAMMIQNPLLYALVLIPTSALLLYAWVTR